MMRPARANLMVILLVAAVLSTFGLIAMLGLSGGGKQAEKKLVVYCAAVMRRPMEKIAADYEQATGVKIELQFGGSHSLLNQLQLDKFSSPDLFLAADDYYTDLALQKGLTKQAMPIASISPVICVRTGNPKEIRTLDDLLRDDVHVVLADPDQAAIGKETKDRLEKISSGSGNLWERLEQAVTQRGVFKPTVADVANDVKLGAMDAGTVWDATVAAKDYHTQLETVVDPRFSGTPNLVTLCVLKSSKQPVAAKKFADYVTSAEQGRKVFAASGFRPAGAFEKNGETKASAP